MAYETKIILDSVSPAGGRLTTFQFTFPRIVLAEFNTHRMFSRNSASSRAIPVEKQLKRVMEDPFIPSYWGKNQKGMSAEQEVDKDTQQRANFRWRLLLANAMDAARDLLEYGIHKQLTNRLLEPWMWHTVTCTATEYENYFALRDNKYAAPEIRDSAHEAHELYRNHSPTLLKDGEHHLPYVTEYDLDKLLEAGKSKQDLRNISVGRCAATSYLTQENVLDPDNDIRRAVDRLLPNGHMSPFEHVAEALDSHRWKEVAGQQAMNWIEKRIPVGNFWGWLSYRKTIPNEHNFKLIG